jgi:hypothetical protein
MTSNTQRKARGFAALDLERRRDISRKGGIAAHRKGTAHQWNPTTAREAGRKGGLAGRSKEQQKTDDHSDPRAQPRDGGDSEPLP